MFAHLYAEIKQVTQCWPSTVFFFLKSEDTGKKIKRTAKPSNCSASRLKDNWETHKLCFSIFTNLCTGCTWIFPGCSFYQGFFYPNQAFFFFFPSLFFPRSYMCSFLQVTTAVAFLPFLLIPYFFGNSHKVLLYNPPPPRLGITTLNHTPDIKCNSITSFQAGFACVREAVT